MEVSGQFHASVALIQVKSPPYQLGGPKKWSGRGGEEKNLIIVPAGN